MRGARASLRDGKRVDSQGFKIRAYLGDGPDESGGPGHGGGPALDAGYSRATVKVSSSGPKEVSLRREETGRDTTAGQRADSESGRAEARAGVHNGQGFGAPGANWAGRRNPKTAAVKKQSPTSLRAGAGL